MRTFIALIALTLLTACGSYKGLQNAGQFQAEVLTYGADVSTNVATGGVGLTLGKKQALLSYNSNVWTDGDGAVREIGSTYGDGAVQDSRSMFTGDNMQIDGGANGAAIGGGKVTSFGPAAFIAACQLGAVVAEGNTGEYCMAAMTKAQ